MQQREVQGAGVGLSATSHFSWRNNNISWYKPFTHQHLGEIGETLKQAQGEDTDLLFLPQARGLYKRDIRHSIYRI
jgi:N-acetyl-gamma-glutamyl-phosphate reductase